jgi:membrane protein involved in colicin uptake
MGTAVEPNLAEVTREEMIRSQMAEIKAKEDAEIRAAAEAKVNAELDAIAEAKRLKAEADAYEKARVEAAKERQKVLKAFSASVAKWMVDNDCDNPQAIPASAVDSLKAQAGL